MTRNRIVSYLALAALAALPGAAGAQIGDHPQQLWQLFSSGIGLPSEEDSYFGAALAAGDFDGDGFDDLAIGAPEFDTNGITDAGLVVVLYSDPDGPSSSHQLWTQADAQLEDDAEENDHFGQTLAAGDFDGDGYDDLAIGVPYESFEGAASAGAVQILYGSSDGLTSVDQFFYQGAGGGAVLGTAEELDRFGVALAVGDFDHDDYDDLAIGVPYETISGETGAGAFHVLFGAVAGLTTVGDRLLYLGDGMPRVPDAGDNLGWSLAAGNFDGLAAGDELAVGAPGADDGAKLGAGAVWIVADLDGTPDASPFDLDDLEIGDVSAFGDQFGCSLAAGQFDGVGVEDLAIGACRRLASGEGDAGKVYVNYFSKRTPTTISQDGLPDEQAEPDDFFGITLAAGDFDADGVDDLAVGVHFEDRAEGSEVGVVHLLPGVHGSGLTKTGAQTLMQAVDSPEAGDRFGQALAVGRFSGHSGVDLAVGAPYEFDTVIEWVGAVNVFFSDALFVEDFEGGDLVPWSAVAGAL